MRNLFVAKRVVVLVDFWMMMLAITAASVGHVTIGLN